MDLPLFYPGLFSPGLVYGGSIRLQSGEYKLHNEYGHDWNNGGTLARNGETHAEYDSTDHADKDHVDYGFEKEVTDVTGSYSPSGGSQSSATSWHKHAVLDGYNAVDFTTNDPEGDNYWFWLRDHNVTNIDLPSSGTPSGAYDTLETGNNHTDLGIQYTVLMLPNESGSASSHTDLFEGLEDPPEVPWNPPATFTEHRGEPGDSNEPSIIPGLGLPQSLRPAEKLTITINGQPLRTQREPINDLDAILLKYDRGEQLNGLEIAAAAIMWGGPEGAELQRRDPITIFRIINARIPLRDSGPMVSAREMTRAEEIEAFQGGLEVVSYLPGVGSGASALNAAIYAWKGNFKQAAIDALGAIPFEKFFAKGGKLIGKFAGASENAVEVAKPLVVAVEKTGGELVPSGAKYLGEWGETRLGNLLGWAGNKASFWTSWGWRHIDRLVDGIAHEAKAGVNVRLNQKIVNQVMKDKELIEDGIIKGAHWHFWQGADPELLEFLDLHGIKYTVH